MKIISFYLPWLDQIILFLILYINKWIKGNFILILIFYANYIDSFFNWRLFELYLQVF